MPSRPVKRRRCRSELAVDKLLDALEECTAAGLDPWPYGVLEDDPPYGALGIALDDGTEVVWSPAGTWDRVAAEWLTSSPDTP